MPNTAVRFWRTPEYSAGDGALSFEERCTSSLPNRSGACARYRNARAVSHEPDHAAARARSKIATRSVIIAHAAEKISAVFDARPALSCEARRCLRY